MRAATCKAKKNARVTVGDCEDGNYIIELKRMLEPDEEDENVPPYVKTQRRMKTTVIRVSQDSLLATISCLNLLLNNNNRVIKP